MTEAVSRSTTFPWRAMRRRSREVMFRRRCSSRWAERRRWATTSASRSLSEHYPYQLNSGDTLAFAIANIVAGINAFSATMTAAATGATVTITYAGTGRPSSSTTGTNGNIVGAYTYVSGAGTEDVGRGVETLFRRNIAHTMANHIAVCLAHRIRARAGSRQCDPEIAVDLCSGSAGGRLRAQRVPSGGFELDSNGNGTGLFHRGAGEPAH